MTEALVGASLAFASSFIYVLLKDRSQRAPVNAEWLKMFPDAHSRPARHALPMDNMEGGALVQCDFTAVID